ncbi:MAG: hypothetical protein WCG95_04730 [bacterium]
MEAIQSQFYVYATKPGNGYEINGLTLISKRLKNFQIISRLLPKSDILTRKNNSELLTKLQKFVPIWKEWLETEKSILPSLRKTYGDLVTTDHEYLEKILAAIQAKT